jgi:hypothetical protein
MNPGVNYIRLLDPTRSIDALINYRQCRGSRDDPAASPLPSLAGRPCPDGRTFRIGDAGRLPRSRRK